MPQNEARDTYYAVIQQLLYEFMGSRPALQPVLLIAYPQPEGVGAPSPSSTIWPFK